MTSLARIARVIPRLLLCVAVLTCVLSLGEAGGAASRLQAAGQGAVTSGAHGGHAAGAQAADAHGPAGLASSGLPAPSGEHAGHGGAGSVIHAVTCMSMSGQDVLGLLGVLKPVGAAVLVAPLVRPMPSAVLGQLPRPPDRSTLCVQRV